MFQYAVARRLAHGHGATLKLDLSEFETYKLREYSLKPFRIEAGIAGDEDLETVERRSPSLSQRLLRLLRRHPANPGIRYIAEKKPFVFDPDILTLPDGVYLDGYWQSEKYFFDIADIIRREFEVRTAQAGEDREVAENILSCESVSLHVRRGDYVSNPATHSFHGVCSLDYYAAGIAYIAEYTRNPRLFVFSDDTAWAIENLNPSIPATFISHNGPEKNYEDLRLMSQCRHHIIANSSFSWWGAWLNPSPSKIVISPTRWIASEQMETDDLLPESWIRL